MGTVTAKLDRSKNRQLSRKIHTPSKNGPLCACMAKNRPPLTKNAPP